MNTVSLEDKNELLETSLEEAKSDGEIPLEDDLQAENETEPILDEQAQDDEYQEHEQEEDAEKDEQQIDYTALSLTELTKVAKNVLKLDDIPKMLGQFAQIDKVAKELERKEEAEDKKLYIQKLGTSANFEYKPSNEVKSYNKVYESYRSIKNDHQKAIAKRQKEALGQKNEILKELNDLININFDYNKIRQLLKEWKAITDIPPAEERKQRDIYSELIQRFNFQNQVNLKFLRLEEDKNLERKKNICKKAEALIEYKDPYQAYKEFQEILEEFKEVGPVPLKNKDEIWETLSGIRNQIRKNRNEAVKKHREVLKANLLVKEKILERLKPFSTFESKNLKEWYKATDQIKQIQKEWYAVGHIPKTAIQATKQKYREYADGFYERKKQFFKDVDDIKRKNLELKTKIYNQIQAVKNTKDLQKGGEKIVELQKEWYKIGAVPEKDQEIEKNFKTVCDTFFNNRREYYKERNTNIKLILKTKQTFIDNLDDLELSRANFESRIEEEIDKFIEDINDLPVKSAKEIIKKFVAKIGVLAAKCKFDQTKIKQITFSSHVIIISSIPNLNISAVRERNKLFKQVNTLIYEAQVLENNLSFFKTSNSKKGLNQEVVKFRKKLESIRRNLNDKQTKLATYRRYLKSS